MLPAALVLIVLGVVLGLVVFPWGGFVAAAVGVVLLVAYLIGFGRRALSPRP